MRQPHRLLPLFFLATLSACLFPGAGGQGGGARSLPPSCRGGFGDSDDARAVATFLEASDTFVATAGEIDGRLNGICRQFGADLGMSSAEIDAAAGATLHVCNQVTGRLRGEMAAIRAARIKARLETTEPVCTTRIDEYRQCIERCDTKVVREGRFEYRCEGGELRGGCAAECRGQCAARVEGRCDGACEGVCSGGCSGVCNGVCEGTCAVRGPDGHCAGSCQGTCRGSCSAGCSGSCSGQCVLSAQASCQGECRGGCSVEFREPVCTGRLIAPEVRTECRESCETVRVAHQQCTPGEARLIVDASEAAEAAARANRVSFAVASRLGEIRALGGRLLDLRDAGELMVRTGGGFASGMVRLTADAFACTALAAAELPRAANQVSVSFQVTVAFSAAVDVSAN